MKSNSREYWEYRFNNDWEEKGGDGQTAALGNMLLQSIPNWLSNDIRVRRLSICDAGCANGELIGLLKKKYSDNLVGGFDFSEKAVKKATELNTGCEVFQDDICTFSERFGVIITSNVLEHFKDPGPVLNHIAEQADDHIIVMVPFQQIGHDDEHEAFFDLSSFPVFLADLFLSYMEILDLRGTKEALWEGDQLLLVYSNREYLAINEFNANDLFGNHCKGIVSKAEYDRVCEQYNALIQSNNKHYMELQTANQVANALRDQVDSLLAHQTDLALKNQQALAELLTQESSVRNTLLGEQEKRFIELLEEKNGHISIQKKENADLQLQVNIINNDAVAEREKNSALKEENAELKHGIEAVTTERLTLEKELEELHTTITERERGLDSCVLMASTLIPTTENAIEQIERKRVKKMLRAAGVGSAFIHAGVKEKCRILFACISRLFGGKREIKHEERSPYYILKDHLLRIKHELYQIIESGFFDRPKAGEGVPIPLKVLPNVLQTDSEPDKLSHFPVKSGVGTKKRIAYLTNQVLDWSDGRPRFGGGERYLLNLAVLLKDHGYEVDIYQPAYDEGESEYYGFRVHLMKAGAGFSEFNISNADAFYEISLEYDHVIYNLPEYSSMRMRKDALMICHGIWFDHNNYGDFIKFREPEWMGYLYRAFSNPLKIVSVDTNSINVIRAFFPELTEKMSFIPNFVDTEVFSPPTKPRNNEKLVVLFPRRSQVNRGSRILEDILGHISGDVVFYWVGEGDAEDTALIRDLSTKDPRLHYECSDFEGMPAWYRVADIAVIPTIACEGTSLSCIEAMACGCATVATNVGGLTDIVFDDINGLCVDPNPAAIASAINRLIEDRQLRIRLQEAGVRYASRLSLVQWRNRWETVLEQLKWIPSKKKSSRICIITRNAIHGGVESLICLEKKALGADVIVAGGLNNESHSCPFEYRYISSYKELLTTLENYDVALYHWIPDWAVQAVAVSGIFSIEFVHRIDTAECDKNVPDIIVSHSQYILDYIKENYGIEKRMYIVPNGTDVSRFLPVTQREEKKIVGAVTSYYHTKGIDILIKAWKQVDKNIKRGYSLQLWGSGTDLDEYRSLAASDKDIVLHGPTSSPEEIYDDMILYVTAARIEGLPISVLEAMSADLPVIASDIEGHKAINKTAEANGFPCPLKTFPSENITALAKEIEDYLRSPWKANTRNMTETLFSGEAHCRSLMKLIDEYWTKA